MKNSKKTIQVFLDEETKAFAEFEPPVKFILDTQKLPDGKHSLKIVANSSRGLKGIKIIPFEVRNGPMIHVIGLKDNDIVERKIPITINAYGNEKDTEFIISGSETPRAIPSWIWAMIILFIAFGLFYLAMYLNPDFYKSFI